jgi:hypothetical protein
VDAGSRPVDVGVPGELVGACTAAAGFSASVTARSFACSSGREATAKADDYVAAMRWSGEPNA